MPIDTESNGIELPVWFPYLVERIRPLEQHVEQEDLRWQAIESHMLEVRDHMAESHGTIADLLASNTAADTLAGQIVSRSFGLLSLSIESTRDVFRSAAGIPLGIAVVVAVAGLFGMGVAYGDTIIGAAVSAPHAPQVANLDADTNEND